MKGTYYTRGSREYWFLQLVSTLENRGSSITEDRVIRSQNFYQISQVRLLNGEGRKDTCSIWI